VGEEEQTEPGEYCWRISREKVQLREYDCIQPRSLSRRCRCGSVVEALFMVIGTSQRRCPRCTCQLCGEQFADHVIQKRAACAWSGPPNNASVPILAVLQRKMPKKSLASIQESLLGPCADETRLNSPTPAQL